MPERIQQKRTEGWRMPTNARSVARPHYYGNPYKPGQVYLVGPTLPFPVPTARTWAGTCGLPSIKAVKCANVEQAISWFRQWAAHALDPDKIALLRGMDLACWCKEGQPCHADVLLELANS